MLFFILNTTLLMFLMFLDGAVRKTSHLQRLRHLSQLRRSDSTSITDLMGSVLMSETKEEQLLGGYYGR